MDIKISEIKAFEKIVKAIREEVKKVGVEPSKKKRGVKFFHEKKNGFVEKRFSRSFIEETSIEFFQKPKEERDLVNIAVKVSEKSYLSKGKKTTRRIHFKVWGHKNGDYFFGDRSITYKEDGIVELSKTMSFLEKAAEDIGNMIPKDDHKELIDLIAAKAIDAGGNLEHVSTNKLKSGRKYEERAVCVLYLPSRNYTIAIKEDYIRIDSKNSHGFSATLEKNLANEFLESLPQFDILNGTPPEIINDKNSKFYSDMKQYMGELLHEIFGKFSISRDHTYFGGDILTYNVDGFEYVARLSGSDAFFRNGKSTLKIKGECMEDYPDPGSESYQILVNTLRAMYESKGIKCQTLQCATTTSAIDPDSVIDIKTQGRGQINYNLLPGSI